MLRKTRSGVEADNSASVRRRRRRRRRRRGSYNHTQ